MWRFRETEKGGSTASDAGDGKIRCPKCGYRPKRSDRWSCTCGHMWNTFDTRGVCPGCDAKWRDTACPSCHQWSLHEDWYEKKSK